MLYFSGGGPTIPWVNTKVYDQTKDEKQAAGWCPTVLDTNGDGKITKPWNEPVGGGRVAGTKAAAADGSGKFDPKLDTRVNAGSYGIIVSPVDDSVWAAVDAAIPGAFVRLDIGKQSAGDLHEPRCTRCPTTRRELTTGRAASTSIATASSGRRCRAAAASRASIAGSARCSTGPATVDGQHCDEGWTFYPLTDGPTHEGHERQRRLPLLQLGRPVQYVRASATNTPIANGSGSDSLLVLEPEDQRMGRAARAVSARASTRAGSTAASTIRTPAGRAAALWANYGTNFLWHIEGGKGTKSKAVKFQVRPDPLAR